MQNEELTNTVQAIQHHTKKHKSKPKLKSTKIKVIKRLTLANTVVVKVMTTITIHTHGNLGAQ